MTTDFMLYPISVAMQPADGWDAVYSQLQCPVCQFHCAHPGLIETLHGQDNYKACWRGRGNLTVFNFDGECGHSWQICFGFHKGTTIVFARVNPETLFAE